MTSTNGINRIQRAGFLDRIPKHETRRLGADAELHDIQLGDGDVA